MEVIIMKCQKCGMSEVSFHFSSNINGCTTEAHLCSACAAKEGYDVGRLFGAGSIFGGFSPALGSRGVFLPVAFPTFGYSMPATCAPRPQVACRSLPAAGNCNCGKHAPGDTAGNVDGEMMERRELYMQMRAAAEREDYETAAQIRDRIKDLEA